jgi:tetratricopeptide (TPR) repeat protein
MWGLPQSSWTFSNRQPNPQFVLSCSLVLAFALLGLSTAGFDGATFSRLHSSPMKFLRWIGARLSSQPRKRESLNNVHQLLQEAYAHLRLEEYDKARAPLLQAIGSREDINEPETISYILTSLGSTWLLTERYEDGIAFFSTYVDRYSEDSEAFSGRAEALWYAGRLQEAIRDYSRALELKPNNIMSLSGRGQVLGEVGEHGRAIEDLDLALRALEMTSAPDASWTNWYEQIKAFVHNGRAFALAGLGERAAAMGEFEVSIALSPDNAWVYHNRGQVYELASNREKAIADYQKALTKKKPALSPNRKAHAQARIRELSNRS